MHLYTVYENGALRKVEKINFSDNKVFLIDDIKNIYLWFGTKTSKKKREYAVNRANILNAKRKGIAKIQTIIQGKEFGAFLAMIDILKKGIKEKDPQNKRRHELEFDIEDTKELIESGLDPDFEAEIALAAHNLSQENRTYEDLCKNLAEIQLKFIKGKKNLTDAEIKKKSKEIFKSSSTYEELCWLIAELNSLSKKDL